MKIGDKEWWLKQIESRNKSSLQPVLEVIEESPDQPYLYVARKGSTTYPPQGRSSDEKYLKNCFLGIGIFDPESIRLEESVKLGKDRKKMDLVATCFDTSQCVVEFKIVAEKRALGKGRVPISIQDMGSAIGQALLYCSAYAEKYPSQDLNIMSAVCTWLLGTGSSHIISICKRIGVIVITVDSPHYTPNGLACRIYYY